MSLFDSLGKGLLDQVLGKSGPDNNLLGAAAKMISSSEVGGLAGLAQLFARQGEGDAMSSWISTGKNLPISPDAILKVLGEGRIQQLAASLGLSNRDVESGLAKVLPQLVDRLTPDGKLPAGNEAADMLGRLARQFLAGK